MIIDLLTLISLVISFITIYAVTYFFYIYLYKTHDKARSLFHKEVTMLIPAHNEEKNLPRAIKSLLDQDYEGKINIFVLDDGSTDGTSKVLQKYKSVTYYQTGKKGCPVGKTKSVNKGIMLAKSEIIGVLDADSYLDKHAISNMIGEFESESTAAVTPIVKVHNPKSFLERMQNIEYTMSMCVRRLVSSTGGLFMTHGVGTLFRKKALVKVGLFKTGTLTEDLNIALKLISSGYKIRANFNAIGYTVVPEKVRHVIKQRLRWNGGLFENSYWFREMFFNKKYGNLGYFIMPLNITWCVITVYIAVMWLKDTIKNTYYDVKDLILTNFDWSYFFANKFKDFKLLEFNELTILSIISLIMFLIFYAVMSKKIRFGFKDSLTSFLFMPLYFSIFFLMLATVTILTPFYMIKRGGKPWLTDKT